MPITSPLTGKTIPIMPISMLISLMNETKPSFSNKLVFSNAKSATNNIITIPCEPKTTNPPQNEKKESLIYVTNAKISKLCSK